MQVPSLRTVRSQQKSQRDIAASFRWRARFVDIANARRVAKEAHALIIIWLSFSLDVGEHIVGNDFNICSTQEYAAFRWDVLADILARHFIAFDRIISTAHEE